MNTEIKEAVRKWWMKNVISLLFLGAVLFISAGEKNWVMGWMYLVTLLIIIIANSLFMDQQLMVERSQLQKGTKRWDVPLVVFVAIVGPMLSLLVAGLDKRFVWTSGISLELQIVALVFVITGGLLTTWSMAANKFFSAAVRIQLNRKQQVICKGPYRFIRHPGYAGAIVSMMMTPLALGSWFGLIPGTLISLGYILRTFLEDKVLQEELIGYKDYAQKVIYRLLPWVW